MGGFAINLNGIVLEFMYLGEPMTEKDLESIRQVMLKNVIVSDEAVIDKKPKQKAPNHRRPERKLRRGK